MNLGIRHL